MRSFITIVEQSLRERHLQEMPIANWDVSSDFDSNEKEMVSKWTGYSQERLHWSDGDKKAIQSPETMTMVRNAFVNCPHEFNLFFWQGREPDYDPYLQNGKASSAFLKKIFGQDAKRIMDLRSSDSITIVMTNNLSDERHIAMRSPWIVAHRIAHALEGNDGNLSSIFKDFIKNFLTTGYDLEWPDEESEYGYLFARDYVEDFGKTVGTLLGTMKSARNDNLVQMGEWAMETMAQYLIQGRVTLNPLPAIIDEMPLTRDPVKLALVSKILKAFPRTVEKHFERVLKIGMGKVFVV